MTLTFDHGDQMRTCLSSANCNIRYVNLQANDSLKLEDTFTLLPEHLLYMGQAIC